MTKKCAFVKKNKETCGSYPLINSDYCFWHDLATIREAMIARRKGGLNRRVVKVNTDESSDINKPQDRQAFVSAFDSMRALETKFNDLANH